LLSWGYVLQRATALNIQISVALSRVMDEKNAGVPDEETIQMFGVRITGRVVLNLWRILTHEITLNVYSYENVHFHVLHERVPNYSHRDLNIWFDDKLNCWRTISFYLARVEGCLRMLNKLNLVEQYSELARVFGIQFYEVLSRGSQFRVESMMSRTAKAYNYIMVSPSNQQKVKMRAPEMIALTLEPESNFYTDPVVVLDFQSLYPSVIIAYNYCYSTCLGRLEHFSDDKKFPFGCCSLYTSKNVLKQHIKNIHIAPNAVAFLKPEVRRGVLPQMLTEILETRVMVKNAMKANDKKAKPSKALKKLLNARQLGLKLIANVTYGYTGANFSGRMPCVEIADAIVSKGREALENAIKLVNSTKKWGGKVIYGDTDSLFILFPGCSKEQAFKRGHEIADEVTQMNPKPMKLKFEKVYMPCVLQTKKRYVGYSYESVDQKEPTFDAKGIETVRRDTCAATSKILEKSLKILFTTFDTAEVKLYVQRQFQKILNGRISNLQDFVFAKEYRGRENYAPNACVPALQIANRLRSVDPRAEPRKHERVPYVIVYGSDDQPLIELVRQPLELVTNPSLRLNAMYYIERVIIPPLSRVFKLMKIDVLNWFKEVPRKPVYQRSRYYYCKEQGIKPKVISEYFVTRECPVCKRSVDKQFPVDNAPNDSDLCFDCQSNWQLSALAICGEIRDLEIKFGALTKICQSCNGSNDIQQKCRSIDCPQLFRVAQTNMDLATIPYYNSLLKALEIKKASLQF
ncbi:DNA polymerase zeta catalytic subunit-like protein, partial [Leptotrombidium deliense]